MKKFNLLGICLLSATLSFAMKLYAEETTMEKAETQKNETVDNVKSTYRGAKDKSCEMINGKMQCLGKKVKNKASNLSDKAKTKSKELENKVD